MAEDCPWRPSSCVSDTSGTQQVVESASTLGCWTQDYATHGQLTRAQVKAAFQLAKPRLGSTPALPWVLRSACHHLQRPPLLQWTLLSPVIQAHQLGPEQSCHCSACPPGPGLLLLSASPSEAASTITPPNRWARSPRLPPHPGQLSKAGWPILCSLSPQGRPRAQPARASAE